MRMGMHTELSAVKASLDVSALGLAFASLWGYLPPIAAALSLIWSAIQIIEWTTTRLKRRKVRRKH